MDIVDGISNLDSFSKRLSLTLDYLIDYVTTLNLDNRLLENRLVEYEEIVSLNRRFNVEKKN
jgi:hypothetical protein